MVMHPIFSHLIFAMVFWVISFWKQRFITKLQEIERNEEYNAINATVCKLFPILSFYSHLILCLFFAHLQNTIKYAITMMHFAIKHNNTAINILEFNRYN